ncbi:MAG: hypothetical protein HeimC3_51490 [Candidatus Heimdallarchaeota archaeon LC_3]|nr:MAG: hypothetical protein HeimC3_51490 [Candidatus Heimdallarchaeota archaeon LC_3]
MNVRNKLKNFNKTIDDNKTFVTIMAVLYFLPLLTTNTNSSIRGFLFLLTTVLIFGLLTLSFELQLGRGGLLNFGHAALFGVGAYAATFFLDYLESLNLPKEVIINLGIVQIPFSIFLSSLWFFGIIIAILVGCFIGLIMGLTTSRMKGTSFAFVALAFAMLLFSYFDKNPDLSGGETGLQVKSPNMFTSLDYYLLFALILVPIILILFLLVIGNDIIKRRGMFGIVSLSPDPLMDPKYSFHENYQPNFFQINQKIIKIMIFMLVILIIGMIFVIEVIPNLQGMMEAPSQDNIFWIPVNYYFVLTSCVLVYLFVKKLVQSPFGRVVAAISQNEERAKALGYNAYLYKIITMTISGGIAAFAGALFAPTNRQIDPEITLGIGITIDAMIYSIVGGLNTLFGPFMGAALVIISEFRLAEIIDLLNLRIFDIHITGEWWAVFLGAIYISIVLFFPFGVVGTLQVRSRNIANHLRRIRITESDYWWIGFISLILVLYILVNFDLFIDDLTKFLGN